MGTILRVGRSWLSWNWLAVDWKPDDKNNPFLNNPSHSSSFMRMIYFSKIKLIWLEGKTHCVNDPKMSGESAGRIPKRDTTII